MSSGKFKQLKPYLQALRSCKFLQEKPRKPVTVNWRDIRATINQSPIMSHRATTAEDHSDNDSRDESEILTPVGPEADLTKWMSDGLPDLSGFKHCYFDLAAQFDISRYVDILADLADSVSDGTTATSDFASTQLSSIGSMGRTKTQGLVILHLQTMNGGNGHTIERPRRELGGAVDLS